MSAADGNILAPCLWSPYGHMTRQQLVYRLIMIEEQNNLLRLLNTTSMNLLALLRERGAADGVWERGVYDAGCNGAGGTEENEEEEQRGDDDGNGGNRAHRLKQQLLLALREELKPWPGTAIILFFFILSKAIDIPVGLLTNYIFGKIKRE